MKYLKNKISKIGSDLHKKNYVTMLLYTIGGIVLSVAYSIELLKGNRDFSYVFSILALIWGGISYSYFTYRKNPVSVFFRYIVMISYFFFYMFAVLTSTSHLSFVFIVPMIIPLLSYADGKMVFITSVTSFLTVLARTVCLYYQGLLKGQVVVDMEIALICVVLCSVFMAINTLMNENIRQSIQSVAETDSLTGCLNRRSFDRFLSQKDPNRYSCLLFADIDDFKRYNDSYGHDTGDDVLSTIGLILKEEGDKLGFIPYRYGGDEFVLYTENYEEIVKYMKNVNNKITSSPVLCNDVFSTTVSWGSAGYSKINGLDSMESILKQADQNMYNQKKMKKEKTKEEKTKEEQLQ